jgi:hypothetical protein
MSGRRRGGCLRAGVCAVAALLLAPWISWTTHEQSDPLRRMSLADLGLSGKVAVVVVEAAAIYLAPSGPIEGPRMVRETMTFGDDGLLREWAQYGAPGGPGLLHRYTYADGLLAKEEVLSEEETLVERSVYTHEGGGTRTTIERRGSRGELKGSTVYERDAAGKLLVVSEFGSAGALTSKLVYTYELGEERADRYDGAENLVSWSIKKHDARGNVVMVSLYSQGGEESPFTTTYAVDAHGNVTLEETAGRVTLGFILLTPPPSKTSYEYTYDDVGNWTKRVKSVGVAGEDDPRWREAEVTYRRFVYIDD